jgi:hypothetical protein
MLLELEETTVIRSAYLTDCLVIDISVTLQWQIMDLKPLSFFFDLNFTVSDMPSALMNLVPLPQLLHTNNRITGSN